jgi:hypothetical protein
VGVYTKNRSASDEYVDHLNAAAPPAPSRNPEFRDVHDEILANQNIGRSWLRRFIESASGGVSVVSWPKFVTNAYPHRKISVSSPEENRKFFAAKTIRQPGPRKAPKEPEKT